MPELSAILAAHEGAGYVLAPAGFGKTHLIAEATGLSAGRQLVLTHTYAGVNALRNKMRTLGVGSPLFHIDTIASWSLRLSLSYSSTSGWDVPRPKDNKQWRALYDACASLLDHVYVRRIVRASYAGLFVDEYQDCSMAQHNVVLKLARELPSRILGDPLQGIFDFDGETSVNWARDIETNLTKLGVLDIPHRWIRAGAGDLGAWLTEVRTRLEQSQHVDLRHHLPSEVKYVQSVNPQTLSQLQQKTCRYFHPDPLHTVIAIHKGSQKYKAKCHALSRNLSGNFSSIEEIEGKELFSFIKKMDRAQTATARLQEIIRFSKQCMTSITANLPAGVIRGEPVVIRNNTKSPKAAQRSNEYLADPTSARVLEFLLILRMTANINVFRADLFNRALGVLRKHMVHPALTLSEAAEKYQGEFRHRGRLVGRRKLTGTTLLVKGLEFDHAIVLDAPTLSRKELYVALTRGARSLTIISSDPILSPII